MNETVFRELLAESLGREFAEFDSAPEHRFSLRHRLAMKRILERYEKNARELKGVYTPLRSEVMPHYSIKQRMIFALVVIILMTLLAGWFIPIRGITDQQIDWLRSRYDFPNMTTTTCIASKFSGNKDYPWAGFFTESNEYVNFLTDLVDMGLYTKDEMETLRLKPLPLDTRPHPQDPDFRITPLPMNLGSETPLESYRDFVGRLEDDIEYYSRRAKDPSRAVEGDTEYAELLAEKFLPLPKSFLELLEKLYSNAPENPDDADEDQNSILANSDKDDRRYLCEIHEI